MDDLPVFKKCCFCVPLRYGLLTWGYLKLALALLVLSYFIIMVYELSGFIVEGNVFFITTIISIVAVILATEIIIHVVFIIATHKKIVKVLEAYDNYAHFMLTVTIIMTIIDISTYDSKSKTDLVVFLMFLFSIVVQIFLILSLRSEITKLSSNCPHRFVKNNNDPKGTTNSVTGDEQKSMENGTVRIVPGKKEFNLKEIGTKL